MQNSHTYRLINWGKNTPGKEIGFALEINSEF